MDFRIEAGRSYELVNGQVVKIIAWLARAEVFVAEDQGPQGNWRADTWDKQGRWAETFTRLPGDRHPYDIARPVDPA